MTTTMMMAMMAIMMVKVKMVTMLNGRKTKTM